MLHTLNTPLVWVALFIAAHIAVEFRITIKANRRRKKIQSEVGADGIPNWIQKLWWL